MGRRPDTLQPTSKHFSNCPGAWRSEINREIARKREEFDLETEYDTLEQRCEDLYWDLYTHVKRLDWISADEADSPQVIRVLGRSMGFSE